MREKVSVIIPAFNAQKFIVETVTSVLNQTYENLEVIVVDDGSKDNTFRILTDTFGKQIKIIQKENGGVSSARNTGIDSANGDYIAFLDADDYWLPYKLEVQLKSFEIYPDSGVCYSDAYVSGNRTRATNYPVFVDHSWSYKDIFYKENKVLAKINNDFQEVSIYSGNIFKYLMYNGMILPSTAILKRSLIKSSMISWNEANCLSEDSEYFLRFSRISHHSFYQNALLKSPASW